MSGPASYRPLLDAALADPATGVDRLAALPPDELDAALREGVHERGEAVLPLVTALAERGAGPTRRIAKRVLYRLAQSGITPPARETRPVIGRRPERPLRAWLSGIDGSGSRAAWILFEGGYGGLALCSVILNDVEGVMEVAGGEITKKRLETELARLRASQKLPWVELPPEHVIARVSEALALHPARGTGPPPEFSRWQRVFQSTGPGTGADVAPAGENPSVDQTSAPTNDPLLAERAAQLFHLPELMGWFLDPESVQSDAVKLMEARSSRLILSDQIKAEREAAIVTQVLERELTDEARRRWAKRLTEMALIFQMTARPDAAALARAAAGQLMDAGRGIQHIPFARGLAQRALEVASEVASGRISAGDVRRHPPERARSPQ
ncbi:MAG: hypothetical protein DMD82_08675 [Candidatus Rokuibacteriota bacterium]|nr:MAG: hypothetical protein DMD82_08675 [Candidatus Rokubacteria bacterium]